MRFVEILIPLVLGIAAILVLNLWSSNRQQHKLHGLSSSPLLLVSVFNTIIVAILVGNYRPSSEEVDGVWPLFLPLNEGEEDTQCDIEDDDDEDGKYCGSDGDVEDDDDDNSSDEEEDDNSSDEEEDDDSLYIRIESFIAKVNEEWRKERLRDICCNQL